MLSCGVLGLGLNALLLSLNAPNLDILNLTASLIFQVHPYTYTGHLNLRCYTFFFFCPGALSFFGFIAIAAPVANCDWFGGTE